MTWTIKRPKSDGWYWIRNAAAVGLEAEVEPQIVRVYEWVGPYDVLHA